MAISVPLPIGELSISIAALAVARILMQRGWPIISAAWLVGAGGAWAIPEVHPVSLCASGSLYRPCTEAEIASMVVPSVVLAAVAIAILVAHVLGQRTAATH